MRTLTRRASLAVFTLAVPWAHAAAQRDVGPVTIGRTIELDSRVLGETRHLLVHTPPTYENTNTSYSVLYLLDAEYSFRWVTGVVDLLSEAYHIPELVVVGIVNTDRNRDMTPAPGERERVRFPTSGGASPFLNFLREEVIPFVDATHRTVPYRILVGHSLGGLFTIHTMLNEPAIFQAFITSSPSLYWNNQAELSAAEVLFDGQSAFPKSLFLSMGNERNEMVQSARAFAEILDRLAPPDLSWRFEYMEEETHSTTSFVSVCEGLEFIFADLREAARLDGVHFQDYYNGLVAKYGYDVTLPLSFIFQALGHYGRVQWYGDAVDVTAHMADRYPDTFRGELQDYVSRAKGLVGLGEAGVAARLYELVLAEDSQLPEAHEGLGDALVALGNEEAALQSYEAALRLRPDDPAITAKIEQLKNN